ncbi:MAG: PAS domain-containing protein, partial [Rhodospirillaceae bacterium]|nr:PAS domain-containing protein [Rhodospirillaceae bacterium]
MIQDTLPASALTGILDSLPGGVALVDAGARLLYLNRTLADWSGVASDRVLGRDFADLLPATADHDGLAAALSQALAGSPSSHRCDLRFADAVARRVRVECVPQRGDDGSIWGASIVFTALDQPDLPQPDLPYAASDAAMLAGERAFANALIDSVPAIVLLLSPDGAIQRVNSYFEELSGYRLEEIRGKDWISTCLPERIRSEIRSLLATAAGGTRTRGNVNAILLRNGEEREIEWSDTTIRDSTGRVVSLLAVGHDITELLRTQAALRHGQQLMRDVVRLSHIGIFEHDHDSDV